MKTKILLTIICLLIGNNLLGQKLKESKEYYPDGKVKAIYEHSPEQPEVKEGTYIKYDKRKNISEEGFYEKNKKTGLWKYYRHGMLTKEVNYKNDLRHGSYITYSNSKKIEEGNYINDKKTGTWFTYDLEEQVIKEENYKDGLKNGKYVQYKNKVQIEEGTYINDEKSDAWRYYREGALDCEGSYVNGIKNGEWKVFRLSENQEPILTYMANYNNGSIEGGITVYHENGEELIENKDIYVLVEIMPEFPGGQKEMLKFIYFNIKYPHIAKENNIEGKAIVSFTIDEMGFVQNAKIVRDIEGGCGEEALRVVNMMPRWNPGIQRGNPVKVQYNLPVNFKLN